MKMEKLDYINSLKKKLTDFDNANHDLRKRMYVNSKFVNNIKRGRDKIFQSLGWSDKSNEKLREEGRDLPEHGMTMIGLKRLENVESCMREVIRNKIEGDVIELGVWRGG